MKTLLAIRLQLYWLLLLGFALTVALAMLGWWLAYVAPRLGIV